MSRLILLLAGALLLTAAYAGATPADAVNTFHAALLDTMKHGASLGCGGRIQRLKPVIENTFDIPFLAQRVLRRQWAELSPAQRSQFTAVLDEIIVSTYASQFSSHDGETFSTQETQEVAGGNRLVHTRLERRGDVPVSFDYVLHESAGGWRMVNVLADGVSDLALRSSQYDRLYKEKGFDGLIAHMQQQISQNKAGCRSA